MASSSYFRTYSISWIWWWLSQCCWREKQLLDPWIWSYSQKKNLRRNLGLAKTETEWMCNLWFNKKENRMDLLSIYSRYSQHFWILLVVWRMLIWGSNGHMILFDVFITLDSFWIIIIQLILFKIDMIYKKFN